jgi:hypothetical protein
VRVCDREGDVFFVFVCVCVYLRERERERETERRVKAFDGEEAMRA